MLRGRENLVQTCVATMYPNFLTSWCATQLNVMVQWEAEERPPDQEDREEIFVSGDSSQMKSTSSGKDLWIGGLPDSFVAGTVEEATQCLRNLCEPFGETHAVTIRKKLSKESLSWALVTFAEKEPVDKIVEVGLTTNDGTVLRTKVADVFGNMHTDNADHHYLDDLARRHNQKKSKPGVLHVTILSGEDFAKPERAVIRDLSTYVDYTELFNCLAALLIYILVAFIFYRVSASFCLSAVRASCWLFPPDPGCLRGGATFTWLRDYRFRIAS